ncbi:AIFM2 [Lepeophtheirus salmonis]|uniref:Ferroptosis suppressor protein 1 n=2 Tax=Lepeophtheirus salmonis TaxID=72036 RepID=A0A7R8H3J5_LEPSM|nr:AIFM2 [Lepeophtheirus salmonis]CAF2843507.1 AIFM2 [Lepeophtheirus salmonis]
MNPYKSMAYPSLPHSFLHNIPDELVMSKKFIIVGGGYGLRAVLYPDFTENIMIPYAPTFGDHFIQGTVSDIDFEKREVTVSPDIGKFGYTHLVIAVGSRGPFPGKSDAKTKEDVRKCYNDVAGDLDKATDIVIIGGGPVGVELSCEVAERYSSKFITLIHPSENLASKRYDSTGFQNRIKKKLKQFTIEVVQGRVSNLEELTFGTFLKQTVRTMEGNEYSCDVVMNCTGISPEISLTNKIFDDSKFDRFFRLCVTPDLKVEGFDDVYAIGDCCNTDEEKLAIHAENQAECIAHNLLRELEDEEPKPYTTQFDGMFLSLGSRHGAGVFNGWSVPSWIVSLLRSRSLQYPKYWELMEQKEPDYDF